MLVHLKYGFEIDGKTYAWYKKELYILPKFRKLKLQLNNTSKSYYIGKEKYSLFRLKDFTKEINIEIKSNECQF
jgi:hypothetical protein